MSLQVEGLSSWRWKGAYALQQDWWNESPEFRFRDADWCFRCYNFENDVIFLDLFLLRGPFLSAAPFTVSVRVQDVCGTTQLFQKTKRVRPQSECTTLWSGRSEEVERLLPHFRCSSELTFLVTIEEHITGPRYRSFADASAQTSHSAIPCLERLSEDFSKMLDADTNPDVVLRCEGHTTRAHKSVLCSRSPVLAKMLQGDMKEARTGEVDIQDMDVATFRQFIKYLYTGRFDGEQTFDSALPLYEAGDMYAVHCLKRYCSDFLVANLTIENACDVLAVADAHGDPELEERVTAFVLESKVPLSQDTWSAFCEGHSKLAIKVYSQFFRMVSK